MLHTADGARLTGDHLPARVAGAGPPRLFLHGLGSSRVGEKSGALFADAHRHGYAAWRFDQRGHGESDGDLVTLKLSVLIDDARAMLAHIGTPCVFIGSSLGGLVASWAAAFEPEHVRLLALIAPAFGFWQRMAGRPHEEDRIVVENEWIRLEIGDAVVADARRFDETELPARLTMPVEIWHGEQDDVVPVAAVRRVADALGARCGWHEIPGGDHRLADHIDTILAGIARRLARE